MKNALLPLLPILQGNPVRYALVNLLNFNPASPGILPSPQDPDLLNHLSAKKEVREDLERKGGPRRDCSSNPGARHVHGASSRTYVVAGSNIAVHIFKKSRQRVEMPVPERPKISILRVID